MDFTDRYMEEEEEEEDVEEELTHDSNISCYILAEKGLTVYNTSTLKTKFVFQIYLPLYRQQSTELYYTKIKNPMKCIIRCSFF